MDQINQVGAACEWGRATDILVHTPHQEILMGILHAEAALYENPFSLHELILEHQNYMSELAARGINVYQLTDLLLNNTMDAYGRPKEGTVLNDLVDLASKLVDYDLSAIEGDIEREQNRYKRQMVETLHPRDLVNMIFWNPTIHLKPSHFRNSSYEAKYELKPLMNIHYMRDQQITTKKGIVIGKLNSPQREKETMVTKFAIQKLGIEPLYEVKGDGRLEGGDFFPMGEFCLIQQGMRTNFEGIRQLMENDVFGFNEVVVVKDEFQNQEQMHLDTWFNVISDNLAVIDEFRTIPFNRLESGVVDGGEALVDIYRRRDDGTYHKLRENIPFVRYITEEKGFELIVLTHQEQKRYGCNFLTLNQSMVIGVRNVSLRYPKIFSDRKIHYSLLKLENLINGYGGPRCSTQVLRREDQ